jgi:hypothetical protein
MPVGEIAAGITSLNAALSIAKAMVGMRDAEAFRTKAAELQGVLLEALEKAIAAREAQAEQLERVRALEAEMADLKAWGSEKENYELKKIGGGAVAYMLKPSARGSEPPHWLCPNCYTNGKKGFFQITQPELFRCMACGGKLACEDFPRWL